MTLRARMNTQSVIGVGTGAAPPDRTEVKSLLTDVLGKGAGVDPEEVRNKEFTVVLRGYLREEVDAFLDVVADELGRRDALIAERDATIARCQQELTGARTTERSVLVRRLGEEAASILEAADTAAERMKANAAASAERVRSDLQRVSVSLTDVHSLIGEIVSLIDGAGQSLATAGEAAAPPPVTTSEIRLPEASTVAQAGSADEVRTVFSEVLGLDAEAAGEQPAAEIELSDESSEVQGGPPPA
jgi:DivIVA domain-containing protein